MSPGVSRTPLARLRIFLEGMGGCQRVTDIGRQLGNENCFPSHMQLVLCESLRAVDLPSNAGA